MKLSRQGYGDIVTVKNLDVGTFMHLIQYEIYLDKYTQVFRDLNKK